MTQNKSTAYLMMIGSMLIYGTIGIFRRWIPLSSGILACARGLIGALALYLFIRLRGGKLRHGVELRKVLLLALSGGLMGLNWVALFEAYNYTTVAVATLCYYMQPTIVILLSPLLFREKLTPQKLCCALISITGMVLVSGVFSGEARQSGNLKGIVLGLIAAVLYSSVVILNKKVQIEDDYEKTVIQLLSAAIVLIPYLLITEDFSSLQLTGFSVFMIFVVGILHTGLAYALYFGSMRALPAQSIAVLSYIDPVSALILSAMILAEPLSLPEILGAVLIIGAALISELKLRKDRN